MLEEEIEDGMVRTAEGLLEVGKRYNLSSLREGEAGQVNDLRFVVEERWAEDRVSGATQVLFEIGRRKTFTWDYEDPKVIFLGTGVSLNFPKEGE